MEWYLTLFEDKVEKKENRPQWREKKVYTYKKITVNMGEKKAYQCGQISC